MIYNIPCCPKFPTSDDYPRCLKSLTSDYYVCSLRLPNKTPIIQKFTPKPKK